MTQQRDRAAQSEEEVKRLFGLSFAPPQIAVPQAPEGFIGDIIRGIVDPPERIGGKGSNFEFSPELAIAGATIATAGTALTGTSIGGAALSAGRAGPLLSGIGGATGISPFSPKRLITRVGGALAGGAIFGGLSGLFGGGVDAEQQAIINKATTEALGETVPDADGTAPPSESGGSFLENALAEAGGLATLLGGEQQEPRAKVGEIRLQTLELPDGTQLFIPVGISVDEAGVEEIIDIGGQPLTQEEITSRLETAKSQQELARAQSFAQISQNLPQLTQFLASPEGRLLLEAQPQGGGGIQGIISGLLGGGGIGGLNVPQGTGRVTQEGLGGVAPLFNAPPTFTPTEEEQVSGGAPIVQGLPAGDLQRTRTPSARALSQLSQEDRDRFSTALGITGESPADLITAQRAVTRRR